MVFTWCEFNRSRVKAAYHHKSRKIFPEQAPPEAVAFREALLAKRFNVRLPKSLQPAEQATHYCEIREDATAF